MIIESEDLLDGGDLGLARERSGSITRLTCPYKCLYSSSVASTRDVRIEIRLKARENRAWRTAAKRSDLTLSEWIRYMCNVGSTSAPVPVPPVVVGDQIELPFSKKAKASKRSS
jgi:hypothetical protein